MINNDTITSMMTDTETFRQKVIDAGIRGNLTEQLPEDGNAEDLYQQIQEEKAKLIKEGKIKKSKPLPSIKPEEITFEIPENWKWVRWGEIINIVSARRVHQSDWRKEGIPFYRAREIAKLADAGKVNNDLFISAKLYDEFSSSGVPQPGDLMVSAVGTLGKTYVVRKSDKFYYKDASVLCFENIANLNPFFLKYMMESGLMRTQINSNSGGTTVDTLTMIRMVQYIIPLPPLAEQERIVNRIDEILDTQKRLAQSLEEYSSNVEVLKSKVIDAGIQGKLTEQLPEDGNAEDLYQQIQTEKAKLVKEGKIKKSKPLPPIKLEEIPFEIPRNWKWVRFENISYIVRGGSPRPIKRYITNDENGINWIKIGDVEKGGKYIFSTNEKIIPEGEKKSRHVYPGDFLLTNSMSFGRPYISRIEGCIHDGWLLIRNLGGFNVDYLYYLLSSGFLYGQFTEKASGSTVDNLNIEKVNSSIIPLPPLSEQERIADKISAILNDI